MITSYIISMCLGNCFFENMIMYSSLNIGKKLRQARKLSNLSMAQVANELHISSRMYAYIETESSSVTLERLIDICNIFECTLSQLLELDEI